jgi:hypothetical protein
MDERDKMTGIGKAPLAGSFHTNRISSREPAQPNVDADSFVTDLLDTNNALIPKKSLDRNCQIPLSLSVEPQGTFLGRLFLKIYKPLSRRIKKIIAKIQGKQYAEVLRVVHLCQGGNHAFQDGWVDSPQAQDKVYGATVSITGWVMGKHVQPTAIRVTANQLTLAEVPLSFPRPDVVKAYFSKSIAFGRNANFGYTIPLAIETLPDEVDLLLEAVFPEGEARPAGLIRFSKYGY